MLSAFSAIDVRRHAIQDGLIAAPAVASWAWVTGMAMAQSGLLHSEALGFSLICYAGTAQLTALPLMIAGAPLLVTFFSALMVNLRFVIYSGALRPSFQQLSLWRRMRLAVIISDMGFAFYMRRESHWLQHPERERYFLWVGAIIYVVWNVASVLGIIASSFIPAEWGINVGGTLVLVALLVPLIRVKAEAVGALTAAVMAVSAHALPLKLGTLLAILSGIVAALIMDYWENARREI
jgi:predicted branched-subunit amino acid permease